MNSKLMKCLNLQPWTWVMGRKEGDSVNYGELVECNQLVHRSQVTLNNFVDSPEGGQDKTC